MREIASSKTINFMAPGSGVLVSWQSLILCREEWFHFDWLSFSYLRFAQLCHRMLCNNFQKKNLNESFFGINSMNNKNDFISLVIVMHINIHCKSHTAFTQVTNKTHGPLIKCNMKAKTWNSCNTRYRINRFNNYILAIFRASNRVKPTYIFILIVNVKFLKANTFW